MRATIHRRERRDDGEIVELHFEFDVAAADIREAREAIVARMYGMFGDEARWILDDSSPNVRLSISAAH